MSVLLVEGEMWGHLYGVGGRFDTVDLGDLVTLHDGLNITSLAFYGRNPDSAPVPDTGSTLALMGIALVAFFFLSGGPACGIGKRSNTERGVKKSGMGTDQRTNPSPVQNTLPVPVLADPNTSRTLRGEAGVGEAKSVSPERESTQNRFGHVHESGNQVSDSRGGQKHSARWTKPMCKTVPIFFECTSYAGALLPEIK